MNMRELEPPSTATIFLIPIIILLVFLINFHKRTRPPLPPGPKPWPFIGNMNLIHKLTHRGLADLAACYGGLFHLKMGCLHIIAVSSPSSAKSVLQNYDAIFSDRPATVAIRYLTYDRADMAFANCGPFWRHMRKLCVVNLFSRKKTESWECVRREVGRATDFVAERVGLEVNLGEVVFSLTRNVIYEAAFGTKGGEGQEEFVAILQEFSKLFGAFNIADFFPWVGWVDPHGLRPRLVNARGALDRFIDNIIDDHMEKQRKARCSLEGERDMVDELLLFFCEDEMKKIKKSEDLQSTLNLTRNNIKAIIMDVMFGGTETVASAIEWAMAEILKNPSELRRAQQELTDVVGLHRRLDEADVVKLTYLNCIVKETLRLHPPIPLLLHETSGDAVIDGYRIPRRSRVMINAWAIGRDPDSWVRPHEFDPSRFLDGGAPDFRGGWFEFVPFGSGRRSCPGMQLGLYALELSVAHLLHCFTWELPCGMDPGDLDMRDQFGLTAPMKTRLVAVPMPRLACPVYTGKTK